MNDFREVPFGDVGDVALAGVDLLVLAVVDVEAGDTESRVREFDRQRQPDVPEPDEADDRGTVLKAPEKLCLN